LSAIFVYPKLEKYQMSLFQESIIRKHLGYLDQEIVDQAYIRYKEVYNANKISNIKVAKEEQYQEGFIKDIFGVVLGYSVFPEQPFNIQTEKKNQADSKKADGAILQGENVVGVIELKDNKTKNLDAVKDQVFGYKNNHKDCSYVISSNFHKLRFYVDDATDYEEFDLYNLDKEAFKRFYLYLRKEGLLDKNIPKLLRQETRFHEENITKSLYKDYSSFKYSFFQNVVKNNPQYDKLLLFKKSQKFLDKVLFVLFAEDKGLVTTNSIVQIVEKWQNLKNDAFDTAKPLYQLVSLFFNNLFVGKKDQNGSILIPEFGGEIFAPDEVLDTLFVDDGVLKDDLLKLSRYDFNTDVDVNILGHIFEHSLSEIEEVEAELKGEEADINKGKRKKDGVFYTPKYITKYIVDNTVGKVCSEKKKELKLDVGIEIFEHQKADGKLNAKGISLYETLCDYKSWLLTLKILDPACGSGAFLNQAVNFLVQEHQFVDDIIAELTNTPLRLFDTDIAILENNIYGVDINEESIEIAKLSLWLRTAKKGRILSNLSNKIKCGNSLIDDPAVAGDKAFHWQKEFPEVFANGGFDVVIGNPPYGALVSSNEKDFLLKKFGCYKQNFDVYTCFMELSFQINKKAGLCSFIIPVSWQSGDAYYDLRKYISEKAKIELAIKLPYDVFEGAYVDTGIYIFKKIIVKEYDSLVYEFPIKSKYVGDLVTDINLKKLPSKYWQDLASLKIVLNPAFYELLPKISRGTIRLSEITSSIRGILPNENDITVTEISGYKKFYIGGLYRYYYSDEFKWVHYGDHLKEKPKDYSYFLGERILIRRLINRQFQIMGTYVHDEFVNKKDLYNLKIINSNYNIKYILALINSKLISYLKTKGAATASKDDFGQLTLSDIREIPIKSILLSEQIKFVENVELIIKLKKEIELNSQKFIRTLERKFALTELSKKLHDWYLFSYAEFIKELEKKKIKLSLSEEAEWETYFTSEAKRALELKSNIEKFDKEIDQMVYELYQLTEDEINIVEGL
jgi:type I restriction-modification system DNA methylase subunit